MSALRLIISVLLLSFLMVWADSPVQADGIAGNTPLALVEEAYLAHCRGNYEDAIKGYTSIIQRRGLTRRERAISYLLRGEAKRDAKQLDESILDFTRAIRQWPRYPQAHFFRGQVYELQGKLVEAYTDIDKALELDPQQQSYLTYQTVLKKRLSEADWKKIALKQAQELAKSKPPQDDTP